MTEMHIGAGVSPQTVAGVHRGRWYPEMPPALPGETADQYTNRLTGADRTGRRPYDHLRNRQCSIGYHDECSDPAGETCKCPCHQEARRDEQRWSGDQPADSRPDTLFHSLRVGELIGQVVTELVQRMTQHDLSKTEPPEVAVFDVVSPRLKTLTYGSDEYRASLAEMGAALQHHYENNRHHPEHHVGGVAGMTLVDLVEMLCDWKAATERHDDGDLEASLDIQRERFGMDYHLWSVLVNTAREFGWISRDA